MTNFCPSKLRQESKLKKRAYFDHRHLSTWKQEHVKTTWIFRPSKLHRKTIRKWRGNSLKFALRRIDIISTSNRRGFDMVCQLGRTIASKKCKTRTNASKNTFFINSSIFLLVSQKSSQGPLEVLDVRTFRGPSGDVSGTSRASWVILAKLKAGNNSEKP